MKCLCCGREIENRSDFDGKNIRWHEKCVRNFFGTKIMPVIDISDKELGSLADKTVTSGYTVPGVQKKLSLHLSKMDQPRLTLVDYPAGYILKPPTSEYTGLPEAEYFCMSLAKQVGIKTVEHALLCNDFMQKKKKEDNDNQYAYITKRADRLSDRQEFTEKRAMEDFCQLSGRLTRDKYRGSYEQCGKIISKYSIKAGLDLSEFYLRILFSFVTGNSDMHLKNFSLIESRPGSREFFLSPAYDLVPVNLILPEDLDETALTLNGKKRNLRKKDFLILAENCNIPQKAAVHMMERMLKQMEKADEECEKSFLSDRMKEQMIQLMHQRKKMLE